MHALKVLIEFSENLLTCGFKEDIKAVSFLRVRPRGSSMVKSYGYLKKLALLR